jgi:hypothetical protein
VRSPDPAALPLLLTHGWPGSFLEFGKVIEPLSEEFHLVIPSLPGYGFSDKPAAPGWGIERIAAAWASLMARLGYPRYGAQGGAVLAHRHGGVLGAAVPGEHPAGPEVVRGGHRRHRGRAGGVLDLPRRDAPAFAAVGREAVHGHPALERAGAGRALRGVRAA